MAAGVGGSSGCVARVLGILGVLGVALVSLRWSLVGVSGRIVGSGNNEVRDSISGLICTTPARPNTQPGTSSTLHTWETLTHVCKIHFYL